MNRMSMASSGTEFARGSVVSSNTTLFDRVLEEREEGSDDEPRTAAARFSTYKDMRT